MQWLFMAENTKLEHAFAKFVALGLGFLFLGQQEAVEATLEVARSVHERIARVAAVMLDTCAYAGTGNVLKVQEMLSICGETIDAEEGAEWKVRGPPPRMHALHLRGDHRRRGEGMRPRLWHTDQHTHHALLCRAPYTTAALSCLLLVSNRLPMLPAWAGWDAVAHWHEGLRQEEALWHHQHTGLHCATPAHKAHQTAACRVVGGGAASAMPRACECATEGVRRAPMRQRVYRRSTRRWRRWAWG